MLTFYNSTCCRWHVCASTLWISKSFRKQRQSAWCQCSNSACVSSGGVVLLNNICQILKVQNSSSCKVCGLGFLSVLSHRLILWLELRKFLQFVFGADWRWRGQVKVWGVSTSVCPSDQRNVRRSLACVICEGLQRDGESLIHHPALFKWRTMTCRGQNRDTKRFRRLTAWRDVCEEAETIASAFV